jgi:hypothetical protein
VSLPTFQTIPSGAYVSIYGTEEITVDIQGSIGHGVQIYDKKIAILTLCAAC